MKSMTREEWQLAIPPYSGGEGCALYSCGYAYYEGKDKSEMMQIDGTSSDEFSAYCRMLESEGYRRTFENAIDGNLYAAYTAPDGGRWYVYYLTADGSTGTARVISESASSEPLEDFCYEMEGQGEFYVFNLNTEADDTYLYRLCDNKWVIIDGGTDKWRNFDPEGRFADSLYEFMRERSGLAEGEKLVIASWYHTHAHRDHFLAFCALIDQHHDDIVLERIIANLPDHDVVDHNTNLPDFRREFSKVQAHFPRVKFLKPHAGMEIRLANLKITMLYSQEDHLDFWVANKERFYSEWSKYSKMDKNDPDYEECRQRYKVYDINNTSTNAIFEMDGLTVLHLGDAYRWHELMKPYYSDRTLLCDVIKAAHHFNNEETVQTYCELCEYATPMYILIPSRCIKLEKNERKIKAALREGQRILLGSPDTVTSFVKRDGRVITEDLKATYSWYNESQKI